ncbi:GGDEF domain-containing phosphodiesterase [Niallia sp. XMNu-256]|uniref:putative bifunctional diguanylate cyclase/phosphodiesterase n=1 Tax=Niallia sp. XMNu-256 TaxID=3082444 RepID=UPI0030CC8B92
MKAQTKASLLDHETGLPSEELIVDRLQMNMAFCRRFHMSTAICYVRTFLPPEINVDEEADLVTRLKKMMVERFNKCIREIDSAGMINENDFLLLLMDVSEKECREIIKRIYRSLSGPYTLKQRSIYISLNMGICMFPYDGDTIADLKLLARTEMIRARQLGDNQYCFYEGNLNDKAYRQVLIESDLSYVVRDQQLYVVYQPQLQLNEQKIFGVEALIRWNHPKLGEIRPDEFIPIAESMGKSNEIFYWILKEVCQHIKLIDAHYDLPIKFSINLSITQLLIPDFVSSICDICEKNGVDKDRLIFEITENSRLYREEKLKATLISLRKLGFMIALDDFGNGYFSFADLIHLPLDVIKFDKKFVTSLIENNKLKPVISPIIDMAHNLNLQVVVEGIETSNQYQDWKQLNGDIIQGYFLSQPVQHTQLLQTLEKIQQEIHG